MNNGLKSSDVETDVENVKKDNNASAVPQIPFWANDPNVLFRPAFLFEFFPMENMTYEQKLNAVTRTILILTLVGFLFSRSFQLVAVSVITVVAIYIMHYYHDKERQKVESKKMMEEIKEGFSNSPGSPALDYLRDNNMPVDTNIFMNSTPQNPFSNVLMTDYDYNPKKKPAPPSFNKTVSGEIASNVKNMVNEANPDFPNISSKLYKDLGDELEFEQSLRQFTSNPATTIPNDQTAFAEFCYGNMISCKEGNLFACARNNSHYTNY
jgi:hypothetical protein